MKSNLFLRVASALVMAPIVLGAILLSDGEFGPSFVALLAVMGGIMAWEWEKMVTDKTSAVAVILSSMSTLVVFLTKDNPVLALTVVVLTTILLYFKTHKNILLSFGALYIGVPLSAMVYIAYYSGFDDLAYSPTYILWLLFVVWATDIGGYIFGKSIGGPKLAPKWSPKKTWAGLFGGMICAGLISYFFVKAVQSYQQIDLPWRFFTLSAIALAVVAQMGDIFESSIKRRLDLKDSSHLIPGHGGIFDRVDGLLFAAPAVAIYILLSNLGVVIQWIR